jgi:hypothetical protein
MSAQSPGAASAAPTKQEQEKQQEKVGQRSEQVLVEQTADQQTIRTGIFPAPRFLRRFAKAR